MKQLKRNVHRVLIAEADDGVRGQLASVLRQAYDVREAVNGHDAVAQLQNEREVPDALITDLELEGINGVHLLTAAHNIDPYLPVLVVATPQRIDAALEALRLGARDCIIKPLDNLELLCGTLERALEERALPEEKERLHRELRQVNRVKDRLLSLVSTDFNQMLQEFDAYCHALDHHGSDVEACLSRVRQTARWMSLRTEQVSIFEELDRYPPKMHPAALNLRDAVVQALQRVPIDAAQHRIDLPETMPRVVADPTRLVQVLENLLCHAVQFSPNGGTITVRAERVGDSIQCSVVDAGGIVGEAVLQHMMEPFARQSRPILPGVHSTGLGLPIARTLVELMNGRLEVHNAEQGVAFRFTLPAPPAPVSA